MPATILQHANWRHSEICIGRKYKRSIKKKSKEIEKICSLKRGQSVCGDLINQVFDCVYHITLT